MKIYYLEGNHKAAIQEGERLLAKDKEASSDQLYYLLGLSYLKDGNYLRASDIFEIILKEFKQSHLKEEAKFALGDTYFLRGDYINAQRHYKELLQEYPHTKYKAFVYYRLSQAGFKEGNTQQAKEYLTRLKDEFPANWQTLTEKEIYKLQDSSADLYYTVQVGAFPRIESARSLQERLIQNGYSAYIEETTLKGQTFYRVRVGKLKTRQEALRLEGKLGQEGYPTKIYP